MTDNQMVKAIVQEIQGNMTRDILSNLQMDAEEAAKFQFNQMLKAGVPAEFAGKIIKLAVGA